MLRCSYRGVWRNGSGETIVGTDPATEDCFVGRNVEGPTWGGGGPGSWAGALGALASGGVGPHVRDHACETNSYVQTFLGRTY